jgi:hypothetical protein
LGGFFYYFSNECNYPKTNNSPDEVSEILPTSFIDGNLHPSAPMEIRIQETKRGFQEELNAT